MRGWKQWMAVMLAAVMTAGMAGGTAYGATNKKKITSVSLTIDSNITVGTEYDPDDIEVRSSSSKYSLDEVAIKNAGFEWSPEDVPQIEVTLLAAENYYFSLSASSITLRGATYVTATKRDSSTYLVITMNLPPLNNQVAQLETAGFNHTGTAFWDTAAGAGSYEVKLYRNDKNVGGTRTTSNTSYQFYDIMTKPATYYIKVRSVNALDQAKKSRWVESGTIYVDEARAQMFAARKEAPAGQWNQEGDSWWYKDADGSFPAGGWKEISGTWYCFDDNGSMRTGWIDWDGKQYYCGDDGAMWFSTAAPDGRQLGADGACME